MQEAIATITAGQLGRRVGASWSVAQILDHLNLTYVRTIGNLEHSLQSGNPSSGQDRGRTRWQRLLITRLGWFPSGRRAPERVLPREAPPEQIASEVIKNLTRMDGLIGQCELRFGPKPIADHPLLGPLTAREWRAFHYSHGKHHEKQIRQLKARFTP